MPDTDSPSTATSTAPTRPDLQKIRQDAEAKHARESSSADRASTRAGAWKAAADKDFSDANQAQQAIRQTELAAQALGIADALPSDHPLRSQAESLGVSLAQQAESLAQPSDDSDPAAA